MTENAQPNFTLQHPPIGSVIDLNLPPNTVRFSDSEFNVLAHITDDGIMHFTVDPTDENAAKFIDCIETFLATRINGIVAKGHHGTSDKEIGEEIIVPGHTVHDGKIVH